jgi:hypothetical protein
MTPTDSLLTRIDETRAACFEALGQGELAGAVAFLSRQGLSPERGVGLLRATAAAEHTAPELLALRPAALAEYGDLDRAVALERALLVLAATESLDRIAGLPVDDSVKRLFCKEFSSFASPPTGSMRRFDMAKSPFVSMSRTVFLIRFPGGLIDWERSGFLKRWIPRVPPRFLLPTLRFLTMEAHGFKPFLRTHMSDNVQPPAFVRQRDVNLSFYRMATAAELQPDIKAMIGAAWLLSAETRRVSPHLECIARPWLEAGAVYTEAGAPTRVDHGFLVGNERRRQLYVAGDYRPTLGVMMCTRQQAIAWKRANAHLAPSIEVQ